MRGCKVLALFLIFVFCVVWGRVSPARCEYENVFRYSGQAVADPRRAELTLTIEGGKVRGKMSAQGISEPNVRLAGFSLDFEGTLTGPWEDDSTRISARWTGVDHFNPDQPNDGTLLIFMKKPEMGEKHVHVRVTGQRGQYGWLFSPIGRVYQPQTQTPQVSTQENGTSTSQTSDSDFEPTIFSAPSNADKWENIASTLPEPMDLSRDEKLAFTSVIHMMTGDERDLF